MSGQMLDLKIHAVGEVRDANGNLVSAEPIEATITCTVEEAAALLGRNPE